MNNKFKIQVPKGHYYENYDYLERFISYYYQIDFVRKLKPKNVLEIGIGNKTVSNYLKQTGIKTDTCDFDKNLEPDYVADIRQLPFKDESYDVVMACEILEHLPWEDLDKALKELNRVSKKHILISIPYPSIYCEIIIHFPIIKSIYFFFQWPFPLKKIEFAGEHYWEMGRKNHPAKVVRKKIKRHFKILEEFRPKLDKYHCLFLLEKK
ncbi:class I SAM-dependent methyltransferase [Candidatus Peregrinibacteria bacterium]|nr:class I SAM-dependent methyltransferase [Candidatus Peregrinibacteria bacterium]